MSMTMDDEFKRWTAKRKAALATEIIQGKTSVAEASRAFDIPPSEIEEWVDEGRKSEKLRDMEGLAESTSPQKSEQTLSLYSA